MREPIKRLAIAAIILWLACSLAQAAERLPIMPQPKDRCPVCGMFVAKYPDFMAEIIFNDGAYAVFDGVKDMMKYFFDLQKYNPGRKPADIASIYVMEYYRLEFINGFRAFYVLGSEVYGPMGKELIPFEKKSEAEQFMKDHQGKSVLTFDEIDVSLINSLD